MSPDKTCERDCRIHGKYTAVFLRKLANKDIFTLCPECENERLVSERDRKKSDEESAQINRKLLARREATIPERYANATLDAFKVESDSQYGAHYIAKYYCDNFHSKPVWNLIFYGFVGTGKTLLAAAIANTLLDKGYSVKFSSVLKITAELKGSYNEESPTTHNEIIEKNAGFDLLILDEVGVQNNTTWELNVLYELINRRYEKKLPTLVVSNIDANELEKDPKKILDLHLSRHLGIRVLDRLRENAGETVFFDWESYRRKSFKQ